MLKIYDNIVSRPRFIYVKQIVCCTIYSNQFLILIDLIKESQMYQNEKGIFTDSDKKNSKRGRKYFKC